MAEFKEFERRFKFKPRLKHGYIRAGIYDRPEMEFKEFEPRFKSAKTRFKLSAGLNL